MHSISRTTLPGFLISRIILIEYVPLCFLFRDSLRELSSFRPIGSISGGAGASPPAGSTALLFDDAKLFYREDEWVTF